MIEIKTAISFVEYHAIIEGVVNGCFPNGTYSPNYYEIIFRTLLLQAFAPEYEMPVLTNDNYNDVWDRVMSDEANEIVTEIRHNRIYPYLEEAIENAIDYRIKLLTSGGMSMSDIALSNLFDVLAKKADEIDVNMLNNEDLNIVKQASSSIHDGTAVEKIANVIIDNVASEKSDDKPDDKPEITTTTDGSDT